MPIVVVISVIMGGMYTGWATPTEVGALGAFIVFVLALLRGRLNFSNLSQSLIENSQAVSNDILSHLGHRYFRAIFLALRGLPLCSSRMGFKPANLALCHTSRNTADVSVSRYVYECNRHVAFDSSSYPPSYY